MTNSQKNAAIVNLAAADRAASTRPHEEANNSIGACPARQSQIFVVPVRYALSEEAASHEAYKPGVTPQSHAMAARRLREGFLYVWQRNGPLEKFSVSLQGQLEKNDSDKNSVINRQGRSAGLYLNKSDEAWLLYTEHPLDAQRCEQLGEREARQKYMRLIDVRQIADNLLASHCPPLADAEKVIAELIPDTFVWAVASDQQRNGEAYRKAADQMGSLVMQDPTPVNIKAYTDVMRWNREREDLTSHYPDARKGSPAPGEWSTQAWEAFQTRDWLEQAHKQANGLWSVFACLDDDLGVLRDINYEQEQLELHHQQWLDDHNLRLGIGGFIRTLITEQASEIANLLNYRYRERDLQITQEQGQILLDINGQLTKLHEEAIRVSRARGRQYSNEQTNRLIEDLRIERQRTVEPVKAFIPVDLHPEVETVVRDYSEEKIANLENHHLSAKVGEYVDLKSMNTWLDQTAPAHYEHVEARHKELYADRAEFLTRHKSGTWFVDYTNTDHRTWLNELAFACLSAQCVRSVGADQYAEYVHSADSGALRQLFYAWSPTLEGALNSETRLGEMLAALSVESQDNARQAMAKVLKPLAEPILSDLSEMARNANGLWSILVKRLGAALLLLKGEHKEHLSKSWTTLLMAVRLANQVGTKILLENGTRILKPFGSGVESLMHWAKSTGRAISTGQAANILNSPAIQNSGGLVPLVVLLLNSWNARNYLNQAAALEGMDDQRVNDTVSATLYLGAALVAVVDSQVRKSLGIESFGRTRAMTPTVTLFGGLIGGLSAAAALKEFKSLQIQLEASRNSLDPWLEIRQTVVGGQIAAYSAQALLGIAYTSRALLGVISVDAAMAGFTLWMGPITWIIAILGVIYLVAWYLQQTPLQNFLQYCCWSKGRAQDFSPISVKQQLEELDRLYVILYAPRISFKTQELVLPADNRDGMRFERYIETLTVDLPGARPNNIRLDVSMIGDPMDYQQWKDLRGAPGFTERPHPTRNMGAHWLRNSACEWIPVKQGQGLRIAGEFKTIPHELGSLPRKISLRLRYGTPFTALWGIQNFIGGSQGLAFTVTPDSGVTVLRNEPTPVLDSAPIYKLGEQACSVFLQPGTKQ
ncbi:toxin VasX [Pseudomonas alliivorans]|nr:toxin VasX [Pseudomonas alliivorans]MEE4710333.1 toxin VasX [Pseudomonas alliivorans]MEE4725060.1 toxin VasX [Pseudomonas alliivorans]MEE4766079.1 toxin VasX [Pseudomonas alliivorans]